MATTQEINGMEIIKNTDIYIVYLAKFAVEEHNRKENAHLKFIKVKKATIEQLVEGVIYYITLEASNLDVQQLWQAKVWVKESTGYIELQDFHHVVELKAVNINDSTDPYVVDFAEFAVREYNKQKTANLVFVKVVSARTEQVLDGTLYYITLEARNGELILAYEATVWAKASNTWPWLELVDFKMLFLKS
ncbi:putative Cystatin domain-containing protein [Dioscorea sansibarensis]